MKAVVTHALTSIWLLLATTKRKFFVDNGLFLASGLAFNLLLYLIPFSLLMISLLGYTVLGSDAAMKDVLSVLQAFLPYSQQALADNLSVVVADRGLLGSFGFVSFFIFSSSLFGSVRTALNRIFQVKQERTVVKGIVVDLLMMGLMAVLLLFTIATTWVITVAGAFTDQYASWRGFLDPGVVLLSKVIGAARENR